MSRKLFFAFWIADDESITPGIAFEPVELIDLVVV